MKLANSNFKKLRKKLGYTQLEFDNVLGLPEQKTSKIENSNAGIDDKVLGKLRKEFNVNLNWLFTGEGEMFKSDKGQNSVSISNHNFGAKNVSSFGGKIETLSIGNGSDNDEIRNIEPSKKELFNLVEKIKDSKAIELLTLEAKSLLLRNELKTPSLAY